MNGSEMKLNFFEYTMNNLRLQDFRIYQMDLKKKYS